MPCPENCLEIIKRVTILFAWDSAIETQLSYFPFDTFRHIFYIIWIIIFELKRCLLLSVCVCDLYLFTYIFMSFIHTIRRMDKHFVVEIKFIVSYTSSLIHTHTHTNTFRNNIEELGKTSTRCIKIYLFHRIDMYVFASYTAPPPFTVSILCISLPFSIVVIVIPLFSIQTTMRNDLIRTISPCFSPSILIHLIILWYNFQCT